MTKKDLFLLFFPAVVLFNIAILLLVWSKTVECRVFVGMSDEGQQRYEQFVDDVKTGNRQLAPEEALKIIGLCRDIFESQRQDGIRVMRTLRGCGWGILGIAVAQTILAFSVRGRCVRPMPNKSLQATAAAPGS
jgi:hypothetical protein